MSFNVFLLNCTLLKITYSKFLRSHCFGKTVIQQLISQIFTSSYSLREREMFRIYQSCEGHVLTKKIDVSSLFFPPLKRRKLDARQCQNSGVQLMWAF